MLLAVREHAGAVRQLLDVAGAQLELVEAHGEQAARDVSLDAVDAVEAAELAADLVDAGCALRLARQQQGQLECALRHRPSSRCRTCSRVMSSSTRMCASSGE